jgi:flavodoxin
MKVLVVYYSRSGNTQLIARAVAHALGADFEPIVEPRSRLGLRGYARSGREAMRRRLTAIEPLLHDPSQYDLVVVGTPTWAALPSSPVRTFLAHYRGELKDVAFFCTCGGSGSERVLREMSRIVGKEPLEVLALRERDLAGDYREKIAGFARRLLAIAAPERARGPAAAHAPS